MEQWKGRVGGRDVRWLASALLLAAGLAQACAGDGDKPSASLPEGGIFGGSGGVAAVPATPTPGAMAGVSAGGSTGVDACQGTPRGMLGLIDDFDDGDNVAAFEPAREAYWFTINDGSPGTMEPKGEFLPVADGYRGTHSAHVTMSGYTVWGAALMANISYKAAVRCPYDASAFAGLRFVARGTGRVRVVLQVPGVVSSEYGGTCDEQAGQVCYDNHGVFVELGPQYQTYELPWVSFRQRGFGASLPFDPKTIFALQFSVELVDLPADLWVDQVEFWDGTPSVDGGGGGAGAGGAAGQAGERGTDAEAGAASGGASAHE